MSGRTSTEAFAAAFGDLDEVEQQLRRYVRRYRFQALRVDKPQNIDADDYPVAALAPDQFNARFGSYLIHTGLNEDGRVALDHALELNPDNALANEALGVLQYRTDAREESRASFEKAAALNGTLYLARYYLSLLEGSSRMDAEGVARVQSLLERVVQMNPFHAPSLARLAMLYASTGEQTELALALARQAAVASPDYPFAYVAQGVAAKENGLMIEAGAALETALRLAPDYQLAQTELEKVKRIQQHPMSGAWTSEAGLWLQIDIDGTTLRCRLTRSGAARQTGTLAGSVITWTTPTADGTAVESSDNVELAGGQLRLESEQGEILLRRADNMPGACEPLFN